MQPLLHREFVVDAPNAQAWEHFVHVEAWPTWAEHIRRMRISTGDTVTPSSVTHMTLKSGLHLRLHVNRYLPGRQFRWFSYLLWLTLDYDHQFEQVDADHTRMIWTVSLEGFGARLIRPLVARLTNRHLDRAIPNLQGELKTA